MSDFKERLQKEHDELLEKVDKLQQFISSKKIEEIEAFQQDMLIIQLSAMTTYLSCLGVRINNLD